jgi:hypothetical protein
VYPRDLTFNFSTIYAAQHFYEYPTNSNCVSVSRGTFQPHRFLRQSTQDDATQEDAVLHGAPHHEPSFTPLLSPPFPPNRQVFVVSVRPKSRMARCGRCARCDRLGQAGFQPRQKPGATRLPPGGLLAEPSAGFAQPAQIRLPNFPSSLFEFSFFVVAFLIRYPGLEINVNHSKQTTAVISNPQIRRCLGTVVIAPPQSHPASCGRNLWSAAALPPLLRLVRRQPDDGRVRTRAEIPRRGRGSVGMTTRTEATSKGNGKWPG